MANRLKQFYRALTAKVDDQDLVLVKSWLSDNELDLFLQMSIIDQKHCINVAHSAKLLAKICTTDEQLLMKATLLHDCGRKNGDLGLLGKSFAVLFDKIFGGHRFTKLNPLQWPKLCYRPYQLLDVYYRHPERSAAALASIHGSEQLIRIVLAHHLPAAETDCLELKLLKQADALN